VMGKAARLEMPVDTCAVPPATRGAIRGANWGHLGWLYTLRGRSRASKGASQGRVYAGSGSRNAWVSEVEETRAESRLDPARTVRLVQHLV
jgi:hypothetical protein